MCGIMLPYSIMIPFRLSYLLQRCLNDIETLDPVTAAEMIQADLEDALAMLRKANLANDSEPVPLIKGVEVGVSGETGVRNL